MLPISLKAKAKEKEESGRDKKKEPYTDADRTPRPNTHIINWLRDLGIMKGESFRCKERRSARRKGELTRMEAFGDCGGSTEELVAERTRQASG